MSLTSTKELVGLGDYFETAEAFFKGLPKAWENAASQVLKMETRQHYHEPDSESWRAWIEDGDWALSMQTLENSRSVDVSLYESLQKRGIEFTRCRPVKYPLSKYMKWEFEVFKFNQRHGERIFCANELAVPGFTENTAEHDFLIFDARVACVHNYDKDGLIVGGWWITDADAIHELIKLHGFLRANSKPFQLVYEANKERLSGYNS